MPDASPRDPGEPLALSERDALLPVPPAEKDQLALFRVEEVPFDWQREWIGMPEFVMGDAAPAQKIVMRFACWEDVKAFGELIGQPITRQTDSLWWPKRTDYVAPRSFLYVDDEP